MASYELRFRASVARDLRRIPTRDVRRILTRIGQKVLERVDASVQAIERFENRGAYRGMFAAIFRERPRVAR